LGQTHQEGGIVDKRSFRRVIHVGSFIPGIARRCMP
jgi:hypothetical protein